MGIDLHYILASPPCRAVMIVAKHLKVDLNLVEVDLFSGEHSKPEYEKVNPQKLVPTLIDDGFILGESRAIITYLVNQYSPGHDLYPADAEKRAVIDRTLYLTAELFNRAKFDIIKPVIFEAKYPVTEQMSASYFELLKVLEKLIAGNKFLAGNEMSIADISFICDLTELTDVMNVDVSKAAPGIASWMETMKEELPEYQELVTEANAGFKKMLEAKNEIKM